jgi:putative transposase
MLQVGRWIEQRKVGISIQVLCLYFAYTRSAYYKAKKERGCKVEITDTVLKLAHRERYLQPRLASDKVFRLIGPELQAQSIKLGRDKLYDIFRENGMLLPKRKQKSIRTTDSRHGFYRYTNLLKDKEITGVNQVWVCDITYIRVGRSWMYLCLIMDAYSRKIVGMCLHDTLEMVGCMKALKMALGTLPKGFNHRQLIHHSDHGVQYCCHEYRSILNKDKVQISMAAVGDCYENAQAERLNGILKQEYRLGEWIPNKAQAVKMVAQAVELYNTRRPHRALSLHTPQEVHQGKVTVAVRMGWPKKKARVAQVASKEEYKSANT